MRRIRAVAIGLAMMVATPGLASADPWPGTRQQAMNFVITRALSQRGVPYAYGGGDVSGPSLGTVSAPSAVVDQAAGTVGVDPFSPAPLPAAVPAPVAEPAPRTTVVGFDASGLIVYSFAGVGIKMPR